MEHIKASNVSILNQLKSVLSQIDSTDYKKHLKILNSSIGQHTRHILEFYLCLFNGFETGVVCYDTRQRDLQIENDLPYSVTTLDQIIKSINDFQVNQNLDLVTGFEQNITQTVQSNYGRELVYLIEHTIHHLAIINIALQESFPKVVVPPNFGVAFSTIKHRNSLYSA
jgi:uncharacterized damage-inducible protein DinB